MVYLIIIPNRKANIFSIAMSNCYVIGIGELAKCKVIPTELCVVEFHMSF